MWSPQKNQTKYNEYEGSKVKQKKQTFPQKLPNYPFSIIEKRQIEHF